MERNKPPKLAKKPLSIKAINRVFTTLIPTDSAASGFSPTALIFNPNGVLYINMCIKNTLIKTKYVKTLCPDNTLPKKGMFSIIGILTLGSTILSTEDETPLSPDTKNNINIVPPAAIRLIAIPANISSVLKFNTKNPKNRPTKPPKIIAANNPIQELLNIALKITPISAANSIIPSKAILNMPDLEDTAPAKVAKRIGVVTLKITLKKAAENNISNTVILFNSFRIYCRFSFFSYHSVFVFS